MSALEPEAQVFLSVNWLLSCANLTSLSAPLYGHTLAHSSHFVAEAWCVLSLGLFTLAPQLPVGYGCLLHFGLLSSWFSVS